MCLAQQVRGGGTCPVAPLLATALTAENQEERLFFNETALAYCENSEVQIAVFCMLRGWKLVQRFTFCLSSTWCKWEFVKPRYFDLTIWWRHCENHLLYCIVRLSQLRKTWSVMHHVLILGGLYIVYPPSNRRPTWINIHGSTGESRFFWYSILRTKKCFLYMDLLRSDTTPDFLKLPKFSKISIFQTLMFRN